MIFTYFYLFIFIGVTILEYSTLFPDLCILDGLEEMWTVGNSSPWHLQETKMEMASRQTWALWNEGISTSVQFHHLRNYGFPRQFTHHHLQHVVSEFNFPLDKTLHSHSALGMLCAPFDFLKQQLRQRQMNRSRAAAQRPLRGKGKG